MAIRVLCKGILGPGMEETHIQRMDIRLATQGMALKRMAFLLATQDMKAGMEAIP